MPVFKKLGPTDQIDNVMILSPSYTLISGSEGWRGSPEGSASLSLYGGARRRSGVFNLIEYQSSAPNVFQTGNPIRGFPITSSVSLAYMTDEQLNFTQVTSTRWGKEHWNVVGRLYDDYAVINADYVTASYDYYCLYFNKDSTNILIDNVRDDFGRALQPSASFCLESWVKPFMTASTDSDFTIQSMNSSFWFGITGSTGRLMMSSSIAVATSSFGLSCNRWNHVAFSYDSTTQTGSLYIDFVPAGTLVSPSASLASLGRYFSIGNQVLSDGVGFNSATGRPKRSFHGLIGECRYWEGTMGPSQFQALSTSRLTGSAAGGPIVYLMLNEGPLIGPIGPNSQPAVAGSGVLDYAGFARGRGGDYSMGKLMGFSDRVGPVWHPNDNIRFSPTKIRAGSVTIPATNGTYENWGPVKFNDLRQMLVIDIPSVFYGRQILPGSVRMTCRAFESFGFVRTIVDDGRGGLYLSGSVCSSSLSNREEYTGVGWNKVGNVFYSEGLAIIKDPSLLDFGRTDGAALDQQSTFTLSFKGDSRVPVKTVMCRIDHGEFNCTTNQTFYMTGSAGERLRRHSSGSIRVSTVGLYNSDRELVGVARLADPVRIRSKDRINIKVRIDF